MDKKPFISLKVKISIGVVSVSLLLGILAVLLMNGIATDIIDKEYVDKAEQITKAVVNTLDAQDVKKLTDDVMDIYMNVDAVVPSSEWGSDAWNKYMSNYDAISDEPEFGRLRQ